MDIIKSKLKNKEYIIYRAFIKNKNGKNYIGFTSNSLNKRKKAHKSKAYYMNSNYHFHNALRKYGFDNFKWEIIDTTNSLEKAHNLEKFYIKKYDSFKNGYNSTLGGEGTVGIIASEKQRESARRKQKLYLSKFIEKQKIKIKCTSNNKVYESMSEAAKKLNLDVESISLVVNGKISHTKGLIFEALDKKIREKQIKNFKKRQKIKDKQKCKIIYENNGKIYDSITEAANDLNLQIGNLSKVLNGYRKHTCDYTFKIIKGSIYDRKYRKQ